MSVCTHAYTGKSSMYIRNLLSSMNTKQKARVQLINNNQNHQSEPAELVITCLCVMTHSGHLCVGGSDNSVTIYEITPPVSVLYICVYICGLQLTVCAV